MQNEVKVEVEVFVLFFAILPYIIVEVVGMAFIEDSIKMKRLVYLFSKLISLRLLKVIITVVKIYLIISRGLNGTFWVFM